MDSISNTDVLIVGAGPTGLLLACQLALNHIPFRIIDKTEDHTTQSRALVIQARSLEIFDQMGIAEKAIQQGQVAKAIGAFFNGKKVLRFTVNEIGRGLTKFPNLLMLEQSHTEKILVDLLKEHGQEVERKTELKHLTQNQQEVISVLKRNDGKEETITTKYVVGADGAHSLVREQLDIPFGGKTYKQSLFVLDCKADVPIPNDEMYLSFSEKAFGGFFPLTNGRWRILGSIPTDLEGKEEIEFEDIKKNFAEGNRMKIKLYDPQWISAYHSHHRYASSFRKNRCFLAGDAAHIHSPVGAQGMNTGLQDAYNLAWKLTLVLKGKANDSILDTYTEERITIAKTLVGTTDRVFNFVTSRGFLLKTFRLYIVPVVLRLVVPLFQKLKFVQRFAFKIISEIGISYNKNSLAQNASFGKFSNQAPKPGDRLPFISFQDKYGNETNIQEVVKGKFFCFLIFSDKSQNQIDALIEPFRDLFSTELISLTPETKVLYKEFGIKTEGYYLIRPDRYIAYRADRMVTGHFTKYHSQFFGTMKTVL